MQQSAVAWALHDDVSGKREELRLDRLEPIVRWAGSGAGAKAWAGCEPLMHEEDKASGKQAGRGDTAIS